MKIDFSQNKYKQFCSAIIDSGYKDNTLSEILQNKQISLQDKIIVIRHDVDHFPKFALEMANIEHSFGIHTSYYFKAPFNKNNKIIRAIAKLEHEIGLHYECLDKTKGNFQRAGNMLKKELDSLRIITNTATVSMHGNPFSQFDNRDIWKYFLFKQFKLIGEAYLSMDFEKILYYSDTGRTWQDGKFNIKDYIPKSKLCTVKPVLKTTDDLIKLINCDDRNIYLLIHPSRWSGTIQEWIFSYGSDFFINRIKLIYNFLWKKNMNV